MGAPITDNTRMGRKAAPIRRKLQRLVRRIERTPPEGVRPTNYGGHNFLSPRGWIGKQLYDFHLTPDNPEPTGFRWHSADQAATYVRILYNGGGASTKQLTIMEAFLTWIEPVVSQHEAEVELTRRQKLVDERQNVITGSTVREDERYAITLPPVEPSEGIKYEGDFTPQERIAEPSEAVSEPPVRFLGDGTRAPFAHEVYDPELEAMSRGVLLLSPLDHGQRDRVMRYLTNRFNVAVD